MLRVRFRPALRFSLIFVLTLAFAASGALAQDVDHRNATSEHGMVVSRSVEASDIGAAILEQGGNAVDAAIATGFALAVTYPFAGNIGGGGFMLVHPGDGRDPAFVDYREKAPLASTEDMYVDGGSRKNHRWVGVPGTVAGFVLAHEQFGSLPWEALVMPAVRLAEDGFVLNSLAAGAAGNFEPGLNLTLERSENDEFKRVYGKNGGVEPNAAWQSTDRLVLSDLGRTLRRIAVLGHDGFYAGETADLLVAEMERGGGYITKEDLSRYSAVMREPIRTTFRGYEIFGSPPPSSGGVVLTIMLGILENFDLKAKGRWTPETEHLIIEAMRRAYADRARYLGDPDFVDIPRHLTTKDYARQLAASIDPGARDDEREARPEVDRGGGESGDDALLAHRPERHGRVQYVHARVGLRLGCRRRRRRLPPEQPDGRLQPEPGCDERAGRHRHRRQSRRARKADAQLDGADHRRPRRQGRAGDRQPRRPGHPQ